MHQIEIALCLKWILAIDFHRIHEWILWILAKSFARIQIDSPKGTQTSDPGFSSLDIEQDCTSLNQGKSVIT